MQLISGGHLSSYQVLGLSPVPTTLAPESLPLITMLCSLYFYTFKKKAKGLTFTVFKKIIFLGI